jgi:hypothetical protein
MKNSCLTTPFLESVWVKRGVFANILFLALDPVFVSRIVEGLELDSDRIELVKQRRGIDPTLHHIALALQAGIQSRSAMLLTACIRRHYQQRSPFRCFLAGRIKQAV